MVSHNNDRKYYRIAIDTAKEGDEIFNLTEYFKSRVGDHNYGLQMTWYEQGSLKNVKGLKPYIRGNVGHYSIGDNGEIIMAPDAAVVSYVGDPSDTDVAGRVVYRFPEQMFPQEGIFYGFIGLIDDSDGDQRLSGVNVWFKVLAGVAYMGKASAYYIDEMDKLIHNSEEQIRQLLDQGQKDVDAKQAALQTIVDDYKTKMSDLIERLNAQGQTANSMMETVKAGLSALETKIQQDGLFTQAEAEAFKQAITNLLGDPSAFKAEGVSLTDKIKSEFEGRGVSVKWFGAKGDGTTNDYLAIKQAVEYCEELAGESDGEHSYYHATVFFPKGKYYMMGDPIILSNVTLRGEDKFSSIIVSDQAEAAFSLKMHSTITDMGFEDGTDKNIDGQTVKRMLSVDKMGLGTTSAYFGIRLKNLFFRGQEGIKDASGQLKPQLWTTDCIYLDIDGFGLWDIQVDDITCNYVHSGITVDTQNQGWMTGAYFNNVLVRGFNGWHTAIKSSNNTMRQVTQNVFSNFTAETLYRTNPTNAIGYIVSGGGNEWQNLCLFNDGNFSGHAIQLRYFGGPDHNAHEAAFGTGFAANNVFRGGTLEGDIDDPDGIRKMQRFDNVRLQVKNSAGGVEQVWVNNNQHYNLLSTETIQKSLSLSYLFDGVGAKELHNVYDAYGNGIKIVTGDSVVIWSALFTAPDQTLAALKGKDFSIGIKYRKITENSEIQSGNISFDNKGLTYSGLQKTVENKGFSDDLNEKVFIYKSDDTYYQNIDPDSYQTNRIYFKISPNSQIVIYDIFLCLGQVSSFSSVTQADNANTQIQAGCYNYVDNPTRYSLVSSSPVTNQVATNVAIELDKDKLQMLTGKPVTISADFNIKNLKNENISGRWAAMVDLELKFSDGTSLSQAAGIVNRNWSQVRSRNGIYFQIPNKIITRAILLLALPNGFTADSFNLRNPQIESGTVMHDFIH